MWDILESRTSQNKVRVIHLSWDGVWSLPPPFSPSLPRKLKALKKLHLAKEKEN